MKEASLPPVGTLHWLLWPEGSCRPINNGIRPAVRRDDMQRITSFVLAAALSCGFLLATADSANAQRRGSRGGSRGGYYSGGGYHGGSYYGHGYYRDGYYRPGVFLGFGVYPGYYGYRSYPYGTYYYDEPYYSEAPPVVSGDYEQAEPPARSIQPAESGETQLQVIVPDEQAQLWLDGLRMSSTGATRNFGFPDEGPGQTYMHKLTVSWMRDGKPITQEREVQVPGGKLAVIDFTRSAPEKKR
jgi:uncharacterized protein (TIGR03000 family)